MSCAHEARRPVYVEADVVRAAQAALSGVDADPHPHVPAGRPGVSGQRQLRGNCGADCVGCGGEGDEEAVALGPHLDAAALCDCAPDKLIVGFKQRGK